MIFSDLDGTLLDHETYGFDAAVPALARLATLGVRVCLASSKTAAEMLPLRARMGLGDAPMICENGGGVVGADVGDAARGAYGALRDALAALRPGPADLFEGFADMGADRIAALTGLAPRDAALAAQRIFTEPGLWHGTPAQETAFVETLQVHGIVARRGGRFLTLGAGHTKADRMAEIAQHLGATRTAAFGDAPNDAEMLAAADFGAIISNISGPGIANLPGEAQGNIRRSTRPGPEGWAEMVPWVLRAANITE